MRLDMRAGLLLVALMLASFPVVSWCDTPPRDALQPWNPSLSSQGQPGYDARLDEPVKFWQPGITLAEVFASIRQQTGVTLGFFPADDENQRVRVHLFLNPGEPPSLRSLLVQLAWVTDCSFSEAEQDGQIAYYLMATSIAVRRRRGVEGARGAGAYGGGSDAAGSPGQAGGTAGGVGASARRGDRPLSGQG